MSEEDNDRILYADVETSIKCPIGKNKASPFWPRNKIVWLGWKWGLECTINITQGIDFDFTPHPDYCKVFVAQNAAFDLQYLMKSNPQWYEWAIKMSGKLWDTMLAEYLLTGQQAKFISLDDLAIKYGGTVKPEGEGSPKDYWEKGIDTEDIPEDVIKPYLEGDVRNLKIIHEGQLKAAKGLGMLPLIESQMDARLATAVMEFQGMYFDTEKAKILAEELRTEYIKIESACKAAMRVVVPYLEEHEINPNSPMHVSAVLFGGTIKTKRKQVVVDEEGNAVIYKSGMKKGLAKTKNFDLEFEVDGLYKSTVSPNDKGQYPVGEVALKRLKDDTGLVDNLLKLREFKKQISTYFEGYSELVFPDGCIHGSLNHCQTNTGRLSSSAPNLQNVNNKEVK